MVELEGLRNIFLLNVEHVHTLQVDDITAIEQVYPSLKVLKLRNIQLNLKSYRKHVCPALIAIHYIGRRTLKEIGGYTAHYKEKICTINF